MSLNHPRWLAALSLCLVSQTAAADALGERIAAAGTSSGTVACSSCHGADGAGNAAAGFPALAGMDAGYLSAQLKQIRDGSRGSPVMQASLGPITDAEIAAVSGHYAALPPLAPAAAPDADTAGLGQKLAEVGDWPGRDLPACTSCHGPGGRGVGAAFPAIAGQHASYISAQLQAWRAGERATDPNNMMGSVADKLTQEEIEAVSAWFAAQPLGGDQ